MGLTTDDGTIFCLDGHSVSRGAGHVDGPDRWVLFDEEGEEVLTFEMPPGAGEQSVEIAAKVAARAFALGRRLGCVEGAAAARTAILTALGIGR